MHEYFRQIWHIFRIYCPDVSCEQHLLEAKHFSLSICRSC